MTGLSCGVVYDIAVDAYDVAGNHSSKTSRGTSTAACAPTGLVASYAFGEGAGTTTLDSSGDGNTGTTTNAAWASGHTGTALSFNGTTSVVNVPDAPSLDLTSSLTLEAWVNPSSLGGNWRTVVFKQRPQGMTYALYGHNGSDPAGAVYTSAEQNLPGLLCFH